MERHDDNSVNIFVTIFIIQFTVNLYQAANREWSGCLNLAPFLTRQFADIIELLTF